MNRTPRYFAVALLAFAASLSPSIALVDDARSFAIEAALPWLRAKEKPFAIRDAWWNGDAKVKEPKIFRHQLFKRNEYWFWAATSDLEATVSIAIYDSAGKLVQPAEKMKKGNTAGVKIVPKASGTYFVRVVVESAKSPTAHWAVVYGYR